MLIADPDPGYIFDCWGGTDGDEVADDEAENTSITVLDDYSITACFVKPDITATLEGGNRPEEGYTDLPLTLRLYDEGIILSSANILTEDYEYEYTTDDNEITITDFDTDNHTIQFDVDWDCDNGTYHMTLTSPYDLINLQNDLEISTNQTIDMGELLGGNPNNDAIINGADFSMILNDYLSQPEDNNWNNGRCDFDRTLLVDALDYSIHAMNYNETSPVDVGGDKGSSGMDTFSQVAMSINFDNMNLFSKSNTLYATITVDAGEQPVDAIDACLNFDAEYLEVTGVIPGDTLPMVLANKFDNKKGTIDLSLARDLKTDAPNGTFTLATIEFTVKKATAETALTFETKSPRETTIAYHGQSILGDLTDGKIAVK